VAVLAGRYRLPPKSWQVNSYYHLRLRELGVSMAATCWGCGWAAAVAGNGHSARASLCEISVG